MMRLIIRILPFAVLAACSYFFYDWADTRDRQERADVSETTPVFYARNVTTKHFNPDGVLYGTVAAGEAEYFQNSDKTVFTMPTVTYVPALDPNNKEAARVNNRNVWMIKADRGTMAGSDTIFLKGGVVASSAGGGESPVREIKTSYLEIDLGAEEIRTPEVVTISGDHFTNSGKNLTGRLASKYFELSEDCHATYFGSTFAK